MVDVELQSSISIAVSKPVIQPKYSPAALLLSSIAATISSSTVAILLTSPVIDERRNLHSPSHPS